MELADFPENADVNHYDWECMFGGDYDTAQDWHDLRGGPPAALTPTRFSIGSVVEVVAWHGYSPVGYGSVDLLAVLKLSEPDCYVVATAATDTTGWGCREWLDFTYCTDLEDVKLYGLTDEQRRRLGWAEPEQPGSLPVLPAGLRYSDDGTIRCLRCGAGRLGYVRPECAQQVCSTL